MRPNPFRPQRPADQVYLAVRFDGLLKIGRTGNLVARFKSLNRDYLSVQLLYIIPGWIELERELHERFDDYRVYHHLDFINAAGGHFRRITATEWFEAAEDIFDWFEANAKRYHRFNCRFDELIYRDKEEA